MTKESNIFPLNEEDNNQTGPDFPDIKVLKKGLKVQGTRDNVKALCDYLGYQPKMNLMTSDIHVPPELAPEITTTADFISYLTSEAEKYDLAEQAINNHFGSICNANGFHPVRDWLDQGTWDGKPRVRALLKTFNFKHAELSITIMIYWLVSAVAALYEDVFKTKITPIIQSGQSCIKSTLVERIATIPSISGDSFLGEASLDPKNKDDIKNATDSWITELAEFESTTKSEIGKLKAFLTKHTDKVRFPYYKGATTKPRRSVFIGTVNNQNFLRDQTGNKRFAVLPIVGPVDIETANEILGWEYNKGSSKLAHPENQRQFWLEVKTLYESGHGWNLPDSIIEQTEAINKNFTEIDPIEERFDRYFHTSITLHTQEYTSTQVCEILKLNAMQYAMKMGKFLTARFGPSRRVQRQGTFHRVYDLSIRDDIDQIGNSKRAQQRGNL